MQIQKWVKKQIENEAEKKKGMKLKTEKKKMMKKREGAVDDGKQRKYDVYDVINNYQFCSMQRSLQSPSYMLNTIKVIQFLGEFFLHAKFKLNTELLSEYLAAF